PNWCHPDGDKDRREEQVEEGGRAEDHQGAAATHDAVAGRMSRCASATLSRRGRGLRRPFGWRSVGLDLRQQRDSVGTRSCRLPAHAAHRFVYGARMSPPKLFGIRGLTAVATATVLTTLAFAGPA